MPPAPSGMTPGLTRLGLVLGVYLEGELAGMLPGTLQCDQNGSVTLLLSSPAQPGEVPRPDDLENLTLADSARYRPVESSGLSSDIFSLTAVLWSAAQDQQWVRIWPCAGVTGIVDRKDIKLDQSQWPASMELYVERGDLSQFLVDADFAQIITN